MGIIQNETGVIKQNPITLYKVSVWLVLNISSPELANPGTVSFNLRLPFVQHGSLWERRAGEKRRSSRPESGGHRR